MVIDSWEMEILILWLASLISFHEACGSSKVLIMLLSVKKKVQRKLGILSLIWDMQS